MQKLYPLLTSRDSSAEDLIKYDCSFAIIQAKRAMFVHKRNMMTGLTDSVKKAFRHQKNIRVLTIGHSGKSKHFPIIKKRKEDSNEIDNIYLIKDERNTRSF